MNSRIVTGGASRPGPAPAAVARGIARGIARRLIGDKRGIAAVEFAIVLPILIVLVLVTVETGRYLLLNLKLGHAVTTMADLATRERDLSVATLDTLFASVEPITRPFPFAAAGVIIVSGVTEVAGGRMTVSWQRRGAGVLTVISAVGVEGGTAVLPATLDVGTDQTMVVAEGFYLYEPWLLGTVPTRLLRHVAYYRPRLGLLTRLS